jgi:hypothetical protein
MTTQNAAAEVVLLRDLTASVTEQCRPERSYSAWAALCFPVPGTASKITLPPEKPILTVPKARRSSGGVSEVIDPGVWSARRPPDIFNKVCLLTERGNIMVIACDCAAGVPMVLDSMVSRFVVTGILLQVLTEWALSANDTTKTMTARSVG